MASQPACQGNSLLPNMVPHLAKGRRAARQLRVCLQIEGHNVTIVRKSFDARRSHRTFTYIVDVDAAAVRAAHARPHARQGQLERCGASGAVGDFMVLGSADIYSIAQLFRPSVASHTYAVAECEVQGGLLSEAEQCMQQHLQAWCSMTCFLKHTIPGYLTDCTAGPQSMVSAQLGPQVWSVLLCRVQSDAPFQLQQPAPPSLEAVFSKPTPRRDPVVVIGR